MRKPTIGIGADVSRGAAKGDRDKAFAYMTYAEAVRKAGAIPLLIPPQPENVPDLMGGLDGVLLAGGDDCDPAVYGEERHPNCEPMDPRRQANDLALAAEARRRGIPTLGICLGIQVMSVAAGGKLMQHIPTEVDTDLEHAGPPSNRSRHGVTIEGGTRLASILCERQLEVNSSHHQAVRTAGDGLRVSAKAPDGIIEGLEDPSHPFYIGVQWHPEDMSGEISASSLFTAFVEAARAHARRRDKTINVAVASE